MNKVYKVIWNTSLGCWIAVSELAKSKNKTSSSKLLEKNSTQIISIENGLNAFALKKVISYLLLASGCIASSLTYAVGINSVSLGINADSVGNFSIAIGNKAQSGTSDNIIGNDSIAIGSQTVTAGSQAVGIGADVLAAGNSSVAIGGDDLNKVAGTNNNSVLAQAYKSITGENLVRSYDGKIGTNSQYISTTTGDGSVAIGVQANASGGLSASLGTRAQSLGVGSTAVGVGATADKYGSVALGAGSSTDSNATKVQSATLNGLSYSGFAGTTGFNGDVNVDIGRQVSVGKIGNERQIKNVAPGGISSTSTDAINGSQLYATNAVLGNVANTTKNILGGNAALNPNGSIGITNIGNTGKNNIHDAILATRTEVVKGTNVANVNKTAGTNGQDIYTINADGAKASAGSAAVSVIAGAKDANNVTDYRVDLSQTTKDSLVKADNALQTVVTQIDGKDVKTVSKANNKVNFVTGNNIELKDDGKGGISVATAENVTFTTVNTTNLTATGDTKLGDHFTVNKGGSYYTGPVTEGNHVTNKTYVDSQSSAAKSQVEEGKNIKVSSTTGTNGQTIYTVATADDVDFSKVTVGDSVLTTNGLTISGGPSITKTGINAGSQKITDVLEGEISSTSKDAVNGSQLYGLGNNVTSLFGGNATYAGTQIIWNNIGGTGQNTVDDAIKFVNDQATNANQGWKISTDSGSSAISTVKPGDTVNIKGDTTSGVTVTNSGNDVTVGLGNKITVGSGNNAVSIDGNAGKIQVGDVSIDGATGNITAGKVTVDGQAGTVNGLTNTTWDPNNIVSGQAATEDQLKLAAQNASESATKAKTTVTAGENITVSTNQNVDGSTNYQVATNKDVKFDTVTSDKVSVGNVIIDQAGINVGGNKITNVADGAISSTSKDVINGSQLHQSNTNIYNYLGGGANYETNTAPTYNVGGGTHHNVGDALGALDEKVTNLGDQLNQSFATTNKRIDNVEKQANAGVAAAMALETAPFVAGKWTYAAAAAHHGGEQAIGVTLRKTADNGRWAITGGVAKATEGDFSFRIGVSGVIN